MSKMGYYRVMCRLLHTNHFQLSVDYKFPKGASGRSFQYQWLQSFPWLVYSKQEDGGFCLPCVLFTPAGCRGSNPGVLVSRSFTVFKKALETLRKHADKEHHKSAIVLALDIERDVVGMDNHSNFVALLNFWIEAGDTVLQKSISVSPHEMLPTHQLWSKTRSS